MIMKNPIFNVDMPDPDVIRVGDTWYMVSTTMFFMPGVPILKSRDLCHWEQAAYVCEQIEDNELYRLENGKHAYGKGQWATSLTHHNGKFYVCFVCHDMGKTYIYSSDDIEKSGWERVVIDDVFHDMSFLFWQDRAYLVYGNGEICLVELEDDLSGVRKGCSPKLLFSTPVEENMLRCEGCRAYVRNGYIYLLFIDWPKGGKRREVCYRASDLNGPWEWKVLLYDDGKLPGCGIAQGVLIDTEAGDWYAMMFQDRGGSGRIPYLMPAGWENDWPWIGVKTETAEGTTEYKVPEYMELPFEEYNAAPFTGSDSFDHTENRLSSVWQWNHNPDAENWSFTERPGWLRLTTGRVTGLQKHESSNGVPIAEGLLEARNTLTQRTTEPGCICTVELDGSKMKVGDYAGLSAFQYRYGQVGLYKDENGMYLLLQQKEEDGTLWCEREKLDSLFEAESRIWLRVIFDYQDQKDIAAFYYSCDGVEFRQIGHELHMIFALELFVGYRIGIFNYASQTAGGCADFRDFVTQTM